MNKWISIEDAVPVLKKNQHCILVLVCTWDKGLEDQDWYEGDVQTAMYFFKSGFKGWMLKPDNLLDDWKETYKGTFRYDYLPDSVTHWMHLPKPPFHEKILTPLEAFEKHDKTNGWKKHGIGAPEDNQDSTYVTLVELLAVKYPDIYKEFVHYKNKFINIMYKETYPNEEFRELGESDD